MREVLEYRGAIDGGRRSFAWLWVAFSLAMLSAVLFPFSFIPMVGGVFLVVCGPISSLSVGFAVMSFMGVVRSGNRLLAVVLLLTLVVGAVPVYWMVLSVTGVVR